MTLDLGAIIGSLRADSFNRRVFEIACTLLPPGVTLTEVSIRDVPLYDGDLESDGDPPAVHAMKRAVAASSGLIVFTPEYNRSIPALTKNSIDWLSRRPGECVLDHQPVGIVASTPGRHDASGVRSHLGQSIAAVTDRAFPVSLGLGSIGHRFDGASRLDDDATEQLEAWLRAFVDHVNQGEDLR